MTEWTSPDGSIRLINADCLDVLPTLEAGSVDAVVTDPPYKISQTYSSNVDADNLLAVSVIWPVAPELLRVCRDGGYVAMFYDTRILPLCMTAMGHSGWKYLRGLTFYRRWGQANKLYGWMSTSDFVLLYRKPAEVPFEFYSNDWRHDVYVKAGPEEDDAGHPAQKPIDFVSHLVSHLCPPGGTVLEPFSGSGTTLVACLREGRSCLACEKDPTHFANSVRRIEAELRQPRLFPAAPVETQSELFGETA